MNLGNGVTRVLDALNRQFGTVVFQAGKPPLDSELNLISDAQSEKLRELIHSAMPSGFMIDPTRAKDDFTCQTNWTNLFKFGSVKEVTGGLESAELDPIIWANVNGWIVPVAGTDVETEGDTSNWVKLFPPPTSESRIDFVFLEVWTSVLSANPATTNKPSASTIWKYGNTKYGGTNYSDDLIWGTVGFETTKRTQIQYRIRVHGQGSGFGSGVALDVYPEGLDDSNIHGQGASSSVSSFSFDNMRTVLGDPSLWRAGDGDPDNDLGTVDGYTYAIPLCAVFRRNSAPYVAVTSSGNPNQNGSFNRNPGAGSLPNPLDGARELNVGVLSAFLAYDTDGSAITVTNLNGCGLEDTDLVLPSTFLKIDNEIVGLSAVNPGGNTFTISGRGLYGTAAAGHLAGATVSFYTNRFDGKFADEIALSDILDLRKAVNPGDWDYSRILEHNVSALFTGDLQTTWKVSGTGSTQGVVVQEVDYLSADAGFAVPNQTEALDGPDGVRTVWSDAAVIQSDVTILLDNEAVKDGNRVGITSANQFDTLVEWDVGPDFKPIGFQNTGGTLAVNSWSNGSHVQFFIGGADGNGGARGTFRAGGTNAVRFVTPKEYWKTGYPVVDANKTGNQYPITCRFLDQRGMEAPPLNVPDPTNHAGPMYPWRNFNFEYPFLVLGGLLNSTLRVQNVPVASFGSTTPQGALELDLGINFEALGSYYSMTDGEFDNDPSTITNPLSNGRRTLYGMLTHNGLDKTGLSSEVYILTYGDPDSRANNGAFRVIGAGRNMTYFPASNATSVVLLPLSIGLGSPDDSTGNTLTVEFRSQDHFTDDISDWPGRIGDLAVVFTDIGGGDAALGYPWTAENMSKSGGGAYDLSLPAAVESKLLVSMSLLYNPGRGATARVPDSIEKIALRGGAVTQSTGAYLHQSPAVRDSGFPLAVNPPETYFPSAHAQTWNRLASRGWQAPTDVSYGGNVIGFTEQDRECEAFIDKGSKSLIFRPFRDRQMTVKGMTFADLTTGTLLGTANYPNAIPKDGLALLTVGKKMGYPLPREFMPRFGRQDIPYYKDVDSGNGPFLPGINHLFTDSATLNNPVFKIIGGEDNVTSGAQVRPLFFVTNEIGTSYGSSATTIGTVNNKPFYGARKTGDLNPVVPYASDIIASLAAVNSSDFGRGLQGIQLPPYVGIARLYGVYERVDYEAKGGRTFKSNRWEIESDPATNLLREDAEAQTLFILKDGAKDFTTSDGDHTYIIPSNALDITKVPTFVLGNTFNTFEYVVEATVFFFAKGWINQNNFVMARLHDGLGVTHSDGENAELEGLHMVIPCPAGLNDQMYLSYSRTVYQGDPYMTRDGNTRTTSDYENRYGQLDVTSQFAMKTAIQQYDSSGVFVPQTPNPRAFQVLASLDFHTTLGTGKFGGDVYPGTVLDVGFTENSLSASIRRPEEITSNPWGTLTRAFTEGQKKNTSRATAVLDITNNTEFGGGNSVGDFYPITFTVPSGTVTLYGCVTGALQTNLAAALVAHGLIGTVFTLDTNTDPVGMTTSALTLAEAVNANDILRAYIRATAFNGRVIFESLVTGSGGNSLKLEIGFIHFTDAPWGASISLGVPVTDLLRLSSAVSNAEPFASLSAHPMPVWTKVNFSGGVDLPFNGGGGNSSIALTGLTERLPLGSLIQDSDFLGENPLNDSASALKIMPAVIRPIQTTLPLTSNGNEFSRFTGAAGEIIGMADGSISTTAFSAYTSANPTGSRRFRLYRGGGSAFMLSGKNPGGPVDWVAETMPAAQQPVLKGGVLVGKALLVKNFYEEALPGGGPFAVSHGDELQMVILTHAVLGNENTTADGITLSGILSPAGYGEGYAAADRYLLNGRPMLRSFSRKVPNPATVTLAPYPEDRRQGSETDNVT